jgi:hypothetical protein
VSEDITKTDLTAEAHTGRASLHLQLETIELEGHTGRLGGAGLKLAARTFSGSPQSIALTTLPLATAICLITVVAWTIGIPAMTALITGMAATAGLYVMVWLTSAAAKR